MKRVLGIAAILLAGMFSPLVYSDEVPLTGFFGVDVLVSICDDNDGDGYEDAACGGDDCNDSNPNIFPTNPNSNCDCAEPTPQGTTEICGNGIDEDCNGADLTCGPCAETAAASTIGSRPGPEAPDLGSLLCYFLLPVGVLIGIIFWRRKR